MPRTSVRNDQDGSVSIAEPMPTKPPPLRKYASKAARCGVGQRARHARVEEHDRAVGLEVRGRELSADRGRRGRRDRERPARRRRLIAARPGGRERVLRARDHEHLRRIRRCRLRPAPTPCSGSTMARLNRARPTLLLRIVSPTVLVLYGARRPSVLIAQRRHVRSFEPSTNRLDGLALQHGCYGFVWRSNEPRRGGDACTGPATPESGSARRMRSRPSLPAQSRSARQDKWLGSVNELTRPLFTQYFNQVTPENARQVGQRGRHDAHRGHALGAARPGVQLRADATASRSTSTCSSGATSSRRGWRRCRAEEQLVEIKKWFAAVAERYPNIEWLQVVNEPLHDPPDCTHSANQGNNCNSSGNYARALGGANGTDGTGLGLDPQRLPAGEAVLPEHQADAQRLQHHRTRHARPTQYLQIINILKRENLIDVGSALAGPRVLDRRRQHGGAQGQPRPPRRDRHADPDHRARHRRRRRPAACPATRCSCAYYRRDRPHLLGAPGRRGHHGLGLAPAQPLAQRPERADRALQRHAQARRALALRLRARHRAGDHGPSSASPSATSTPAASARSQADDWASQIGRPNLRTFTWQLTGGDGAGIFAIVPSTGRAAHRRPATARRAHDLHAEGARERRLPHERARPTSRSSPATWPNVADAERRRHRARDALADALGHGRASARSRPAWPRSTRPPSPPPSRARRATRR